MDSLFQAAEAITPLSLGGFQAAETITPVSLGGFQAAEAISPVSSDPPGALNWNATTEDQHFLLVFIMGTYFGPDLKAEKPKRSALQRIAEGLPSYFADQLSGSQMKTVEMERVYYYVLRKADRSAVVKLPLLHQFLQGSLFPPMHDSTNEWRQFPDLFPPHLHQQSQYKSRYRIVEDIVFINNPEISYIKPEDIERFKRLTRLEDLFLDRDVARSYGSRGVSGLADDVVLQESNGKLPVRRSLRTSQKRRRPRDYLELASQQSFPPILDVLNGSKSCQSKQHNNISYRSLASVAKLNVKPVEKVRSAMLFLPSHPTVDEWNNIVNAAKNGISLTGSIAGKQTGPLIGLVDVGVCEDAYLFRMSLPGVKKDEREFSCEVETDGQVLIKGVTTTGERLVFKKSQVFEMQTQYLCRSGPFSVSFQLPGRVEPQEFSGHFGSDGILEGIVMKEGMGRRLDGIQQMDPNRQGLHHFSLARHHKPVIEQIV